MTFPRKQALAVAAELLSELEPACTRIQIVGSLRRGKPTVGDVEIIIDEAKYMTMTDAEKDALLDHEIHHVELRRNTKGRVKLDEHGRPKCGMKKHDYQFGWFREIAIRHGAASGEVQQARRLYLNEQQTFFTFADDPKLALEQGKRAVKRFQDAMPDGVKATLEHAGKTVVLADKT